MSTLTTKDGTAIYYKDWGEGPAVTFSHGWPLNAEMWDGQMLFLVQKGFRTIGLNADLLAFLQGSPDTSRRGDRVMAAASSAG